jgi:hypothetical protein
MYLKARKEGFRIQASYLLGFFKTGHFPPVGSYVAGMPMAQFEGILCNIAIATK